MNSLVETVTGRLAIEDLGKTMMHEHFIFGYPGFEGDVTLGRYDREEALRVGIDVCEKLQQFGVNTVVDPTPNDCGRDPEMLKEISLRTGMNIVCASGYYYEGEGAPAYFKARVGLSNAEEEIYEMFYKEVTDGIAGTEIKPGVIKVGSSRGVITEYEQMFFRQAARIQKETGIPIMTHTQEGTMGYEQVELLLAHGADPAKVVIGHMDGTTNIRDHLRVLERGVTIGFDRFGLEGLAGTPLDEERKATLLGLLAMGYEEQIILSHDTVNYWRGRPFPESDFMKTVLEKWHVQHLFERVLPELQQSGVTDETLNQIFTGNPSRVFKGQPISVKPS
ncbi:phosphotriesterase [Bacillaceae bacterium JMAK1]|nr:phosphotriesterase [Bacillaceae bacterium JMAK1]